MAHHGCVAQHTIADETRRSRSYPATGFAKLARMYIEQGGEQRFLQRLIDHFLDVPVSRIDQAAIDNAAATLLPGRARSTKNRQIHGPVSAVLKFGASKGLCEYRKVTRPVQEKKPLFLPTDAEIDRFVSACDKRFRRLVIFFLYTGANASEAIYLDWKQINLERQTVRFLKGTGRTVPLHLRVMRRLLASSNRQGAVFRCPDGEPYRPKSEGGGQLKSAFREACDRSGVAGITPRVLRHVWASRHWAAHHDLTVLMEMGGWRSERMARRYTETSPLVSRGGNSSETGYAYAP